MTQGPASAYGLSDQIGNLNPGTFADFIVLKPRFNALNELSTQAFESVEAILFALSFIGDDRAIEATYSAGKECNIDITKKMLAHKLILSESKQKDHHCEKIQF